jgi:hypothetical protein
MSRYGYSWVTNEGLLAFEDVLTHDQTWKAVQGQPLSEQDRSDAEVSLQMRADVLIKSMLLTALVGLKAVTLGGSETPAEADGPWDRVQRLLDLDLSREELSIDAARVEAAQYLRGVLLAGGKTGQTSLSFDAEVDFGVKQSLLAKEPQVAQAITLLGLGERMAEVKSTTERLSHAMGHVGGARAQAKSAQANIARKRCIAAFNNAHQTLALLLDAASGDAARAHLSALIAPFQALLARHSPAPSAPKGEVEPPKVEPPTEPTA